jgi:hypothetical protein
MKTKKDIAEIKALLDDMTTEEISDLVGACAMYIPIIGNWYSKSAIKEYISSDNLRDMAINETLGEGITFDYYYDTMVDMSRDSYEFVTEIFDSYDDAIYESYDDELVRG